MSDTKAPHLEVVRRFGRKMHAARAARGWSLAQLASVLGDDVSRQYLSLIENGLRDPSLSLVARLHVALGMDGDLGAAIWGQKRKLAA